MNLEPDSVDDFVGKYEEIPMMELRRRIGQIMLQVEMGKVFLLTYGKGQKPVAVLSRPPGESLITCVETDGSLSYKL